MALITSPLEPLNRLLNLTTDLASIFGDPRSYALYRIPSTLSAPGVRLASDLLARICDSVHSWLQLCDV